MKLSLTINLYAGVVEQEMLHLSLAGDILRALDGCNLVYDESFMPKYTDKSCILYDQVVLSLEPAKKSLLETFVKVRFSRACTLS